MNKRTFLLFSVVTWLLVLFSTQASASIDIVEAFDNGTGGFSSNQYFSESNGLFIFRGDRDKSGAYLQAWNGGETPGGITPNPFHSNYFENFNLSVDVYWVGGSHYHGYGLYIFYKGTSIVKFVISEDNYNVEIVTSEVSEKSDWKQCSIIAPEGEKNILSIIKKDQHLSFLINGTEVYKSQALPFAPAMLSAFEGGSVGLYSSHQVDVSYDNFKLFNLSSEILYTQDQLNGLVSEQLKKWDAKEDRKIGIEEAINALQIVSGQ